MRFLLEKRNELYGRVLLMSITEKKLARRQEADGVISSADEPVSRCGRQKNRVEYSRKRTRLCPPVILPRMHQEGGTGSNHSQNSTDGSLASHKGSYELSYHTGTMMLVL